MLSNHTAWAPGVVLPLAAAGEAHQDRPAEIVSIGRERTVRLWQPLRRRPGPFARLSPEQLDVCSTVDPALHHSPQVRGFPRPAAGRVFDGRPCTGGRVLYQWLRAIGRRAPCKRGHGSVCPARVRPTAWPSTQKVRLSALASAAAWCGWPRPRHAYMAACASSRCQHATAARTRPPPHT